jgi:hypothetical protein
MTKDKMLIFCILNLLVFSCHSHKENSWKAKKIGKFTFSFPMRSSIFYNSIDSVDGEIRIEKSSSFFVHFSKGYFRPSVLSENRDCIYIKDTIDNFIIRAGVDSAGNKYAILFYAWDTTNLTTLVLNEKRYMGIILSASGLSKGQRNVLLRVLKTFSPSKCAMSNNKKKYLQLLFLGLALTSVGGYCIFHGKYFVSSIPFNTAHRNEATMMTVILGITLIIVSSLNLLKKRN